MGQGAFLVQRGVDALLGVHMELRPILPGLPVFQEKLEVWLSL